MRLEIHTTDGATCAIENFEQDTIMQMLEEIEMGTKKLLTLTMDDGVAYIMKINISRIDVI